MASSLTDGQYYYIMNANTMTSLNVFNSGGPGAPIVGATSKFYAQPGNSVWQALSQGNNQWKFKCPATKTYMWFPLEPALTGLQSWDEVENAKEKWTVKANNKPNSPTQFNIKNVGTALFVDLANGNASNAAVVVSQQGGGSDQPNQLWCFIPTNGP